MSTQNKVSLSTPLEELGFSVPTLARFASEGLLHLGDLVCREEKSTASLFKKDGSFPTLEVVNRNRGLKEPARLTASQIKKVLSLFDPLTKIGRSLEGLLIKNCNHPTEGMANEQAAVNKMLSKNHVEGLKLILCTRRFKSQLWVME